MWSTKMCQTISHKVSILTSVYLHARTHTHTHTHTHTQAARVLRKALVQDHKFEEAALLLSNMYYKMGQVKMAAKV